MSVFLKRVDDDDDQFATITNKSIGCNTIFNELPDVNAMISDDFVVPQSNVFGFNGSICSKYYRK